MTTITTTIGIALAGWMACSLPLTAASSPGSASLFQAVRAGDRAAIQTLLKGGADVHARDEAGNTPLILAAFCADHDVLKILIKAGANVNTTNKAGATPLMRAATFEDKARLLVEHKADVMAVSGLGNTALQLAARQNGNAQTVKLLLNRGAPVNATNLFGATALMAAVAAEDMESVRALLDHGADVNAKPAMNQGGFIWGGGRTPLMWAAFRGNGPLLKLLLSRGAKVDEFSVAGGALAHAAWGGHTAAARILLGAGAPVDQRDLLANYTPLHWAASSERLDPALVKLLLAHHADMNSEGGQPVDGFLGATHTPLQLALKRGNTPIAQDLLKAGARETPKETVKRLSRPARALVGVVDDATVAAAIQLALPPLYKTAAESATAFRRHASQQACVSCHQQELPLSAISLARSRHIRIDELAARQTAELTEQFASDHLELDLQTVFHPEPAIGNGYALMSLHFEKRPASSATDSHVHQLTVAQKRDGSWPWNLPRPPIQSSDFAATALALQGLKQYPIPGRKKEFDERILRARKWLAESRPEFNEERAYQMLGLAWGGERGVKLKPLAEALIREQRDDGGWAQLPHLNSDAFATGQSLYALLSAAGLPASHPSVRRGVQFLLRTQLEDGTWYARRRAFPFQPPMDSGFSHGADGWISASASSWAVMALAMTLDPAQAPILFGAARESAAPALQTAARIREAATDSGATMVRIDFARDIQPLLERSCVGCHSGDRAKGGFQVTSREAILRGGARGEPAVVAHRSTNSPLLRLITDQVEDQEMPPLGKRDKFPALSKEEAGRLASWIDQGVEWPKNVTLQPNQP